MNILLGNLTVKELESEHGFNLSDEHRTALERMRQNKAEVYKTDKFHIFDIPRTILCGSKDVAVNVYEILKLYDIKGHIEIAIDNR